MSHRSLVSGLALILGLCSNACTQDAVLCSPLIPSAVAVVVRDSVTDSLVADSARGAVVAQGRSDSLVRGPVLQFGDSVLVGGTQIGSVTVQVERSGYQPWSRGGVHTRLSGGQCPNFVTKVLTARLQR